MKDWRTAKSLLTLRDQYDKKYPGRNKSADGTIGNEAHQKVVSDHNPDANGIVHALDITHDPAHGLDIGVEAEILRINKDPRIKYVIANKRIFEPSNGGWLWKPYSGTSDPHTGHMHISVNTSNGDDPKKWDIEEGEDQVVDENFLRAFWLDLFGLEPNDTQKKQYIGKNWMAVYNELRNSDPAKQRRAYLTQVEKDNDARAKGLQQAQSMIAELQGEVNDPGAQTKLNAIKKILEN